jgi:hypothetical protein
MSPLFRRFHVLRLLLWAGALLFTGGALLDFAAHLLPALGALPLTAAGLTLETGAHTLTFAGMAVLLVAVLTSAHAKARAVPIAAPSEERRSST